MEQQTLSEFDKQNKFDHLSKEDLIQRNQILQDELIRVVKELYELRNLNISNEQLQLVLEDQIKELQQQIFGSSSEKLKKYKKIKTPKSDPAPKVKKPSERYPNVPIVEKIISMDVVPPCGCCGHELSDSGMTEDSEQLNVIPKKYEIILQKRKKYRCSKCHGDIQTAPAPERIIPGSSYSDEMALDVVLSKYCDLIPIERYAAMAARSGVIDIPPQSLIELTHQCAGFFIRIYRQLKEKVLSTSILHADETPHNMLEGSDKKSWYLWGFSSSSAAYFEIKNTRSGDISSEILKDAICEVLVSDVYSGYDKSIRVTNALRLAQNKPLIKSAKCNSHARRYFFKSRLSFIKESEFYLDQYHEIYKLENSLKEKSLDEALTIRFQMKPYFDKMKDQAIKDLQTFSNKSKFTTAIKYFLNSYEEFTLCLTDPRIPLDNNHQERLLRSPVVGRKTWYGTHSERGAETAAILFSIVESCKLCKVNPREYFKYVTQLLLSGKDPITPDEFISLKIPSG